MNMRGWARASVSLTVLVVVSIAAEPASAQRAASRAPKRPPAIEAPLPATGCVRPTKPEIAAAYTAARLGEADLESQRLARDNYSGAMAGYLQCISGEIEKRLAAPSAGGLDVPVLGREHERASTERAELHERFVRLCLAWEDARQVKAPDACVAASFEPAR